MIIKSKFFLLLFLVKRKETYFIYNPIIIYKIIKEEVIIQIINNIKRFNLLIGLINISL